MRDTGADGGSVGPARIAEVVLPCTELQPTLDFFVGRLGFRLDRISPADDPRSASLSGHGLRILLRRGVDGPPGVLRLTSDDPQALGWVGSDLHAPNGTRIELAEASPATAIPAGRQELVVTRAGDGDWAGGRAGMRYRDLIPGRLGGRFIASLIRIRDAGPVPDQVHFHAVRFQMIYCARGWVRVVYEDQGEPFVLAAGDCVLQPPRIRHRVLESSAGLEVVEVSCPAEHDTFIDHGLGLPTAVARPDRDFDGQRFVRHSARGAAAERAATSARDFGFAQATRGLATARVVRVAAASASSWSWRHQGELLFVYLLTGGLVLSGGTPGPLRLAGGDALVVPAGLDCAAASAGEPVEFLEVRLPAESAAAPGG